jgi:hypothetical protein
MRSQKKVFNAIILWISLIWVSAVCSFCYAENQTVFECKDENVSVRLVLGSEKVNLTADLLFSIEVLCPSNTQIKIPEIGTRLKGFALSGEYQEPAVPAQNNKVLKKYLYKLTPLISDEYRIAPMAIIYCGNEEAQSTTNWLQTPPIKLALAPLSTRTSAKSIRDIMAPFKIYPSRKLILQWVALVLLSIGIIAFAVWVIRYVNLKIKLARMSPKERALYELEQLIKESLISKGKIKDFYLELTMIVRRYIERAHKIKAPELTTEEFLQAITKNPHFSKAVVEKLKAFLETSDLVKFAAYRPDQKIIDDSLRTAEDYIKTDEATAAEEKRAQEEVGRAQ